MFDGFGGHDEIEPARVNRQSVVEIAFDPSDLGWQVGGTGEKIGAGHRSISARLREPQRQPSGPGAEIEHISRCGQFVQAALDAW